MMNPLSGGHVLQLFNKDKYNLLRTMSESSKAEPCDTKYTDSS